MSRCDNLIYYPGIIIIIFHNICIEPRNLQHVDVVMVADSRLLQQSLFISSSILYDVPCSHFTVVLPKPEYQTSLAYKEHYFKNGEERPDSALKINSCIEVKLSIFQQYSNTVLLANFETINCTKKSHSFTNLPFWQHLLANSGWQCPRQAVLGLISTMSST